MSKIFKSPTFFINSQIQRELLGLSSQQVKSSKQRDCVEFGVRNLEAEYETLQSAKDCIKSAIDLKDLERADITNLEAYRILKGSAFSPKNVMLGKNISHINASIKSGTCEQLKSAQNVFSLLVQKLGAVVSTSPEANYDVALGDSVFLLDKQLSAYMDDKLDFIKGLHDVKSEDLQTITSQYEVGIESLLREHELQSAYLQMIKSFDNKQFQDILVAIKGI